MPKYVIRAFGSTLVSYAKDISQRLRLASFQNIALRLRLSSQVQHDFLNRLILDANTSLNLATRLRVLAQSLQNNVGLRILVKSQPVLPNLVQRMRLSTRIMRDIGQRFILQSANRQDYTNRLRLAIASQPRDMHLRANISTPLLSHDLKMRFCLSPYHNANILLFPVLRPMI